LRKKYIHKKKKVRVKKMILEGNPKQPATIHRLECGDKIGGGILRWEVEKIHSLDSVSGGSLVKSGAPASIPTSPRLGDFAFQKRRSDINVK